MNNPPSTPLSATKVPMGYRTLPWLLAILAVGAMLWSWQQSVDSHQRQREYDFRLATEHAVKMLQGRFGFDENIAYAARGLFDSSEVVTDKQWHTFIRALGVLHNEPGVQQIYFSRYEGGLGSVQRPEGMDIRVSADWPHAKRGFSARVSHIEANEESSHLPGYDLAGEPLTRQALHASCASQQAVMTGVFEDPASSRGIMHYLLPVFRKGALLDTGQQCYTALRGWVGIDFDVQRWLGGFVDEVSNRDWNLRIASEGETFFIGGEEAADTQHAAFRQSYELVFGQRPWQLEFVSSHAFEQRLVSLDMHLVPFSILLLLLSLWMVFRQLKGGEVSAAAVTERMTKQLRESEERYRGMFEANKAVELLIDPSDGSIVDANRSAANYYGYSREVLRAMHISDINTLLPDELAAEMERACSEHRDSFLLKHRLASGEARNVEVHSGPINVGGRQLICSIVHDVTARVEHERALRTSEARYHTIIDTTAEGYWLVDLETMRILEVNNALCRILGYRRDELIGCQPFDFADSENHNVFTCHASRISHSKQRGFEIELLHKDGHAVCVEVHATYLPAGDEAPPQVFAFITDISERKRNEEQLRIAATFFETTSEAITVTDMNNRIIAVNPAFCMITGYSEEEVLGQDPGILSSGRNNSTFYRNMWLTLQRMGRWQGEIWNRRKNGEVFPEWLSIVAIKDDKGEIRQYMAVFSDITKRKLDEEKIWRQANYDALTGLPNRNLFKDRLDQAMHAAHRDGSKLALLFIDLDRFKWVNDTLGHAAGDRLLQEVASRMRHCVRETDTVARLGGDEFTVILGDIHDSGEVDHVAESLLHCLAEPFDLNGKEAFVSGSIGITLYPADAVEMEQLLCNADAAMYLAKESGRNIIRYFTEEMNEEAQRRLRLENDLRRVLERNELSLHYQPIISGNGEVAGAEALLRWQHPEFGFIPPDEFIPLAEEIGTIVDIEQWAIHRACRDARLFQQQAGERFFISVNVSGTQCKSNQCQRVLGNILHETGLDAGALKLEITERVMMDNTDYVIALLNEVKAMGVRLAVDDFGTGYSSLSYLKQFPVDVLKIDRAFIAGLPGDKDDMALVEAIVAMAHSLNLQVVAEGVETAEQLAFLRSLGCDLIQGFYYSKPLPFVQFEAYLQRQ